MPHTTKPPILLVDDEPDMLLTVKQLLRRDFTLYTAESGRQALELLREHPIHVVLTDQRMPEMTGMQLLGRVKDLSPQTVRMVFTGYADIKAVIEGINEVGLYRYLTKPWDPDDLTQVLHRAADQYGRVVDQQQLLADLRACLRQGQALVQGLLAEGPNARPAQRDLEELDQTTGQLLQRLDRAVPG
jgi:response regulator RpfG family c-di-GMP phosphodiesterase